MTDSDTNPSALEPITDSALAYLSLEDLLAELLDRIRVLLRADTAVILLVDPDRRVLRARAARGIEEEVRQGVTVPLGAGFAGRIAAQQRPIAIEDLDDADVVNPLLRLKGIRSLLGVPLVDEGRVVGVLHVGALRRRHFDDGDVHLLQATADRVALAIDSAQSSEQRALTEALQRHLLPVRLPTIPGLRVSAKYQPAAGARLGGDWYDVFGFGDGRIGLAIGDVSGRGVAAAATMAEIRTALRAYALLQQPLVRIVSLLNGLMLSGCPRASVTLALFALDLEASELVGVSVGHPPSLLLRADGSRELVVSASGPPLGSSLSFGYEVQRIPFPPGSALVLYTDGLIERRTESIDAGLGRLLAADLDGKRSMSLADRTFALARIEYPSDDDVAVLAIESEPLDKSLELTLSSDPSVLASMRRTINRWLASQRVERDQRGEITSACSEAAANAIAHAYGPGAESFTVNTRAAGEEIIVTVGDHGSWRLPVSGSGGRGLDLMRALVDDVAIERGASGTLVTLRAVRR
jgi:anti-sigma regulatory factor (Ser/Thr protein kinase)/CBS domain-containing protein